MVVTPHPERSAAIGRRVSPEEFLALPDAKPHLELWEGEVRQKAAPSVSHSALQPELTALINAHARPRRLARAFSELHCRVGPRTVLVPDVAVVGWERIARGPDGTLLSEIGGVPDIAIEFRSPSQTLQSLIDKAVRYLDAGTSLVVLVDEAELSTREIRPGRDLLRRTGDDRIDLALLLPDFQLTVRQLFDVLRD
ncbi:MAG: Uma2 family endonuclease [Chloroflexota bacterium]